MHIPGVGILVLQQPLADGELVAQLAEVAERHHAVTAEAQAHLAGAGMSPWEIAELPLTPRRAWYSEEYGFVYPEHPDAQLVLVVEIPMADEPPTPEPVEPIEQIEVLGSE
ncbi:hypothetical protein [Streptosporangium sp. NPDC048865]|uniref:hypothetical protein n=1 Tax=Streptosporangium sp. NPDC048865 TaxID=3155766 RepID=UPI0034262EDC